MAGSLFLSDKRSDRTQVFPTKTLAAPPQLGQLLVVAQTDSCLGRGLRQGLRLVRGVAGAAVADGGLAGEAPGFGQVTTATHRRGLSSRVRKTDQYSHTPRGGLLCHTHFHVSVKLPLYPVQDVGTVHVCEQELVRDDLYVVVDLQLILLCYQATSNCRKASRTHHLVRSQRGKFVDKRSNRRNFPTNQF